MGGALFLRLKRRKCDKARKGRQPVETTYVKRKTKNKTVAARKVPGVTWTLRSEICVCVFTEISGCIEFEDEGA